MVRSLNTRIKDGYKGLWQALLGAVSTNTLTSKGCVLMRLLYPDMKLRNTYYGRYCVILYCHFKVKYFDVSSLHPPSIMEERLEDEVSLIQQYYSSNARITYHADRINLHPHCTDKGCGKEE